MGHGPIGLKISFRYRRPKGHPRDTLKTVNIAPGGPMDRLIIVLALSNTHPGASNRKSSIVHGDRLSCSTHPLKDIVRLEGRRLKLDVDLDIRLPDLQEISRALELLSSGGDGVRRITLVPRGFAPKLKAAVNNKVANIAAPETTDTGLWLQAAPAPQVLKFCLYLCRDSCVQCKWLSSAH